MAEKSCHSADETLRFFDFADYIEVRHLPAGVNSGVGTSRDRQLDRFTEHRRERLLENSTHRADTGLAGPAGELGALVRDVETVPARGSSGTQRSGPAILGRNGGPASFVLRNQED